MCSAGTRGKFCQPCQECHGPSDALAGNCNECSADCTAAGISVWSTGKKVACCSGLAEKSVARVDGNGIYLSRIYPTMQICEAPGGAATKPKLGKPQGSEQLELPQGYEVGMMKSFQSQANP